MIIFNFTSLPDIQKVIDELRETRIELLPDYKMSGQFVYTNENFIYRYTMFNMDLIELEIFKQGE
jgi:hypothetical protein